MAQPIQPVIFKWGPIGAKMMFGTATPTLATEGPFNVGDKIVNTVPTPSGIYAWVCTTAGTGATSVWKSIALSA